MKLSPAGLKNLITEEGFKNDAYPDPAHGWAVPTIGIGHTGPEVHRGLHWSDERVMEAAKNDVSWAEDAVNQAVTVPLTQDQFDALVEFTFNIGATGFKNSTLVKKLNAGNVVGAADEFLKWNIPEILVPRRYRSREHFLGHMGAVPPPNPNTVFHKLTDIQRIVGVTQDGIMGSETKGAIMRWQQAHGLTPDGIVGPKTAKAMGLV